MQQGQGHVRDISKHGRSGKRIDSLWPTWYREKLSEMGIYAVVHKFRYVSVITPDYAGAGVLIGAEHFLHVLRVELGRKFGRADHISEQDG